jgi:hypothetical protein
MHKRAAIKNKIVDMLQAGAFPGYVYKTRYTSPGIDKLPVASVYCPEDDSVLAASSEHYDRTAKVTIMIYALGYDHSEDAENSEQRDIDAELDALTSTVESIFCTPIQTLEGTIYRMYLTKTRYMIDTKGEDIVGIAFMDFDAEYKDSII